MLLVGGDFDSVARHVSEDSRATVGGDWGWIPRKDLRDELAEVAFALEPGETSDPIILERDVFILKIDGKRPAGIAPLAEVRAQVETRLRAEAARDAQQRWIASLRRAARIRVHEIPPG